MITRAVLVTILSILTLLILCPVLSAGDNSKVRGVEPFTTVIDISRDPGKRTFYTEVNFEGYGPTKCLIDTGSGFTTITQLIYDSLSKQNLTEYVGDLSGYFANGTEATYPKYKIRSLHMAPNCKLDEVVVVLFESSNRCILGLSELTRVAPFVFSVDPLELRLTCPLTQ